MISSMIGVDFAVFLRLFEAPLEPVFFDLAEELLFFFVLLLDAIFISSLKPYPECKIPNPWFENIVSEIFGMHNHFL